MLVRHHKYLAGYCHCFHEGCQFLTEYFHCLINSKKITGEKCIEKDNMQMHLSKISIIILCGLTLTINI